MSNEEFSKDIGPQDVKVARDEVTNNDSEDLFEEYYNPTNKYTESAQCGNDILPSACDPSTNLNLAVWALASSRRERPPVDLDALCRRPGITSTLFKHRSAMKS